VQDIRRVIFDFGWQLVSTRLAKSSALGIICNFVCNWAWCKFKSLNKAYNKQIKYLHQSWHVPSNLFCHGIKHFKPFLRILFDKWSDDINKSLSSFPFQAKGFSLLDRMSQHQVKFFRTMPEFHGNPAKNSLDILSRVIKFDRILWHTTQKVSVFGGNEGVT
jgi:hypothetical protein